MRSFKTNSGPFAERVHYSLDEIDRTCVEALAQTGCLPDHPSPIRIDRFIEKRFNCDIAYEDFELGILGCAIFTPTGKVEQIFVSNNLDNGSRPGERRFRSTVAHEGGHGLFHAHLFIQVPHTQDRFDFGGDQKPQDRILCRGTDIGGVEAKSSYNGKWWEFQANRAIGGLLLPKMLVEMAVRDLLKSKGSPGVLNIPREKRDVVVRHIAEVFDVNPVVARIRVEEMWPVNAAPSLF